MKVTDEMVTGDFENNDEAMAYAGHLADKLNSVAKSEGEG